MERGYHGNVLGNPSPTLPPPPRMFGAVCPDKSDKANSAGSFRKKEKKTFQALIHKINCSVCLFFFSFGDDRFLKSSFKLRGLRRLPADA